MVGIYDKALTKPRIMRWHEAVVVCEAFKNQAGCLRLVFVLADYFNDDLGYAFPSRESLSLRLGTHETTISTWTTRLRKEGALRTEPQSAVHEELQHHLDPRGLLYFPHFPWADAILEGRAARKGRLGARRVKRGTVAESTTDPVVESTTQTGSEVHNTYNLAGIPMDNPSRAGSEVEGLSVYARGIGLDLPLDPPETRLEAVHWLEAQGLTVVEIERAVPLLMEGRLYRHQIDALRLRRRVA